MTRSAAGCLALALALPWLIPVGFAPLPFFLNECVALLAWALAIWQLGQLRPVQAGGGRRPALALGLFAATLLLAAWGHALVSQRSLATAGLTLLALGAASLAFLAGRHAASLRSRLWPALAASLLAAALLNALAAMQQVWLPDWGLAPTLPAGRRPTGLIGQANHLGMLMVWALLALGGWQQTACWPLRRWLLPLLLLALGLTLSGSRVAAACWLLACLALAWVPALRRLSALALLAALLALLAAYALAPWAGDTGLLNHLQHGSPSRWVLMHGSLDLLARYPLWGTGWGDFNYAWMLSPRSAATPLMVHHSHNLELQLLAELGWPLGLLTLGLLAVAVADLWRAAWRQRGQGDALPWIAMAMVAAVLLHSQVELPLWFAYWLLPTAFLLGLSAPLGATATAATKPAGARWAPLGVLLALLAVFVLKDWLRILPLYLPSPAAPPYAERLAEAKRSWLFAPWAWQVEALDPQGAQTDFARGAAAPFGGLYLLAWAKQLDAQGDTRRADYLVARVRDLGGSYAESLQRRCAAVVPERFPCRSEPQGLTPDEFRPGR